MNERIDDKIKDVEGYLAELDEYVPSNLEDYLKSRRAQLVCERLFEIILEGIVDIMFIFINEKKIISPEDDESAFDRLINEKVISHELGKKLQEARRMRNIIAHKYGSINNELIFNSIKEELPKDVKTFIKVMRKNLV